MAKVELSHSGLSSPVLRGLREREALFSLPGAETRNAEGAVRRTDWLAGVTCASLEQVGGASPTRAMWLENKGPVGPQNIMG